VLPGEALEVETTCPQWFHLVDDPKKRAEVLEKLTQARSGEPRRPAPPREMSAVALVATIYYNRGIDLLGQRRFADAVAANAKALRLDPNHATARENFAAILNNWAIAEASAGRHDEAVRLLARGIAAVPDFATFYPNRRHVYRAWMRTLLESGRTEAALAVARSARSTLRSSDDWPAWEADEIRQCAARWNAEQRGRDAIDLLDRALQLQPDCSALLEARTQVVSRRQGPATQPPGAVAVEPTEPSGWTSLPERTVE
jgi:tetratricopeptide (TPR) repeat protein